MQNSGDGFEWDPDALRGMSGLMEQGAEALRRPLRDGLDAPDAGASSMAVGRALYTLFSSATNRANQIDRVSDKIHAVKGSYGEIENNAKGKFDLKVEEGRKVSDEFLDDNLRAND